MPRRYVFGCRFLRLRENSPIVEIGVHFAFSPRASLLQKKGMLLFNKAPSVSNDFAFSIS